MLEERAVELEEALAASAAATAEAEALRSQMREQAARLKAAERRIEEQADLISVRQCRPRLADRSAASLKAVNGLAKLLWPVEEP